MNRDILTQSFENYLKKRKLLIEEGLDDTIPENFTPWGDVNWYYQHEEHMRDLVADYASALSDLTKALKLDFNMLNRESGDAISDIGVDLIQYHFEN